MTRDGDASAPDANPVLARIQDLAARCDGSPFLTLVGRDGRETAASYRDFIAGAERWAERYRKAGLRPGDKVVVILEHGAAAYAAYTGALLGGFCPAFLAHPSEKFEGARYRAMVRALLDTIGSRFVVASRASAAPLALEGISGLCEDGEVMAPLPAPAVESRATGGGPLFLQFSSGTTGLKKCVAIRAEALLWQVDAYAKRLRIAPGDRIVSWLPLYHDMGLIACYFLPLLTGVPVVAMSPFDWVRSPGAMLDAITRHRGTLAWLPNFAFNLLAQRAQPAGGVRWDLGSLRALVNCSEPVLQESLDALVARFAPFGLDARAIASCYALAENTFAATASKPGVAPATEAVSGAGLSMGAAVTAAASGAPDARVAVSSGAALPGVELRILGASREILPDGHVGEIALRSPSLFDGYFGNAADTAAAFHDGFFLTGDLGYRSGGDLYVIGRIKDTIIIGGRNVFPQDIEAVVNETDGVIPGRCVAFGVDDPALGTQSLVVVAETRVDGRAARRDLRRRIRHAIAAGADVVPSDVALAGHLWLQKSTSGKLSRNLNRQRYLEACGMDPEGRDGGAEPDRDPLTRDVRACVLRAAGSGPGHAVPVFDDEDDLVRDGVLDSFSVVALQVALEEQFGAARTRAIREHPPAHRSVRAMADALRADGSRPPPALDTPAPARVDDSETPARLALTPQMRDVESQPYQWFAYLMRRGAPDFRSPTLNSDEHGFRCTHRDGRVLGYPGFSAHAGSRGVVLGNSFAYGVGTTHDSRTLASLLNAHDATRSLHWYNFAQRASVMRQERLAFELFGTGTPDWVVWVSGINNLVSLIVGEGLPGNPAPFVGERQFAKRMMPEARFPNVPGSEARYQSMLQQLEIDLSSVALRLGSRGRLLFCLQPSASWVDKAFTPEETRLIERFDAAGAVLQQAHSPRYLRPLRQRFDEDVAAICRRWNAGYVDCNADPRMAGPEWLFIDRTHMTDAGHALVADIVARRIAAG